MYMSGRRPLKVTFIAVTIILMIAFVVSYQFYNARATQTHEPFVAEGVTPTKEHMLSAENKALLLAAIKKTHEIFTKNKIFYCMEGGTLLGAVRHHGLIPWDDDADLMVWKEDQERIMSLRPQFIEAGLELTEEDHERVMRVYCQRNTKFPFIDLFLYTKPTDGDDNMYRCLPYTEDRYDRGVITCKALYAGVGAKETEQKCCYPGQDKAGFSWWWTFQNRGEHLFPLRLYDFDGFQLYGPHNPEPYLKTWYGDDYMTNFKVTHSHAPTPSPD